MAIFEYIALDESNLRVAGTYSEVSSVGKLRCELEKMGYSLVSAKKHKERRRRKRKIKLSDTAIFTYKFSEMLSTGLPVVRCLETLSQHNGNDSFGEILRDIKERVQTGSALHEAFGAYKNVFNEFFLGMIEAGESSGTLSKTLSICAAELEKQVDLRHKLKAAFTYPVILSIVCLSVMAGLMVFVVPVFSNLYAKLHVELPLPTKALILVSGFLRDWSLVMVIIVVAAGFCIKKFSQRGSIRKRWDRFKLKMPVFSRINKLILVARFVKTFSLLYSMGVSLTEAIAVAGRVANNEVFTEISEQIGRSVQAGNPIANSLRAYEIFPPIIVQLSESGEEAGALPEMLNKGVDIIEKDIERSINALLVKLEPILTVVMGLVVGTILMAVYLPMFDYMDKVK